MPYPHQMCPIYATFKDGAVHVSVDDEVFWRKDGTSFPVEYTSTPVIDDGKIAGAVVTFRDITGRKQLERALRQSEERYRLIFENAATMIVSIDREGHVVDCNGRIKQVLNYEPEEIIGHGLIEMIHPDHRGQAQECLNEVLKKGFKYNNKVRMVRKNGTPIEVNINAAVARDENGEYLRTICMVDVVSEGVWA